METEIDPIKPKVALLGSKNCQHLVPFGTRFVAAQNWVSGDYSTRDRVFGVRNMANKTGGFSQQLDLTIRHQRAAMMCMTSRQTASLPTASELACRNRQFALFAQVRKDREQLFACSLPYSS